MTRHSTGASSLGAAVGIMLWVFTLLSIVNFALGYLIAR